MTLTFGYSLLLLFFYFAQNKRLAIRIKDFYTVLYEAYAYMHSSYVRKIF